MKAKGIILFILSGLMCLGVSGQIVKEKKSVDSFTKIVSSSGIDVKFTQSNKHSLEIETDADNMNKIEFSVKNGALELKRKNEVRFKRNTKVVAYVSAQTLETVTFSGGSDFTTTELTNNNLFSVSASGGSDIHIGKLNVNECNLSLSGGSDCDIKELKGKQVTIKASGGSDADIHSNHVEGLIVEASGGSDLNLKGKAKSVTINCSGGSDADITELTYETISSNKSGGSSIKK